MDVIRVIARGIVKAGCHIMFNWKVEGRENIPKNENVVIACNHRSYFDPILNTVVMKKPVAYMAKEELFKNPFLREIITELGAFPVRRGAGDMQVIEDSIEKVKNGSSLIIYPEGTRGKDGRVGRGKTGVVVIAAGAGADILPEAVVFEGEKMGFRKKVTLRIGKPIPAAEVYAAPHDRKAINAAKKRIMDAITELAERDMPPREPKKPKTDAENS